MAAVLRCGSAPPLERRVEPAYPAAFPSGPRPGRLPFRVEIVPNRSAFPNTPSGPRVAVLAYDGLCTFEFGVAYEVFGLPRPEAGPGWYRYAVCAVEPGRSGPGVASRSRSRAGWRCWRRPT